MPKHHAIVLFAVESIYEVIKKVKAFKVPRQPLGTILTTMVTVPP